MGTIKDRNGMGLTETEDIKKRWKEAAESESEVAQSYPTLCHPMDCSLLGSSVHGIFQARVLEWVAISSSRGFSWPCGSAVATGLEKVSFHSNPKERQCQRMMKLVHNCTHFTYYKSKVQNSPSVASTVCEPRTSRRSSWIYKRQRNQRLNCQHTLNHRKSKRVPEKHLLMLYWLRHSLWRCGSKQSGKFLTRWEYQTTLPASWEICMQVKKKQYWRGNNGLVANWERNMSRLPIVTLLI